MPYSFNEPVFTARDRIDTDSEITDDEFADDGQPYQFHECHISLILQLFTHQLRILEKFYN